MLRKRKRNNKPEIKGSLICIMLTLMISSQVALAASVPVEMAGLPEPQSLKENDPASGIVRIQAGSTDEEGNTSIESTASGFIVCSDGSNVYIVTVLHAVDFGEDGVIRITVKNDTTVDAVIESANRENDYCILSAENKFNDKSAVPLRVTAYDAEGEGLSAGDEVTALGFPSSAGSSSDFGPSDVSAQKGSVTSLSGTGSGQIGYDALAVPGTDGGILADKDGYAVGLINSGSGTGSALDISEVDNLLDKEGIPHRTRDKDEAYSELYGLCLSGPDLYNRADKESKPEVKRVWEEGLQVLSERPYDRNALNGAIDDFNGVIESAGMKTTKLRLLVYALAVVIVILAVRLIMLIRWHRKNGSGAPQKSMSQIPQQVSQQMPQSAYPGRNPAGQGGPPRIRVLRTGAELVLGSGSASMGKNADNDLSIPDNNKVSRYHAVIENRGGVYYICDSGSKNGTWLNSMPVDRTGIRLVNGDTIRLASEELVFIQ